MFTDDEFVKEWKTKLTDPMVLAFWDKEMAKTSDFHKSEMLGYFNFQSGPVCGKSMIRNIIGQSHSGFNFREIMDKKNSNRKLGQRFGGRNKLKSAGFNYCF